MAQITIPVTTAEALTENQRAAYLALELAREQGNEDLQRKARRLLRKSGIYLSRIHGHTGAITLTPEPAKVTTDTPAKAEKRVKPVKTEKPEPQD